MAGEPTFEYDIALSFAGEDRLAAEELAAALREAGVRVFYDRYEEAQLWGKDLYQHLQCVYRDSARFCVIFISAAYARKLWTRHELQQAQARAFEESIEYILPLRLDSTELPGINRTVGYVSIHDRTIPQIVALLLAKLRESDRHREPHATIEHLGTGSMDAADSPHYRRLLTDLGWKCAGLLHSPPQFVAQVRQSLVAAAREFGIFASDERLPLESSAVVDLIGRRVTLRLGARGEAAFMLGRLAPAAVEHSRNPSYHRDVEKFYLQLHNRRLSPADSELLWSELSEASVSDIYEVFLALAETAMGAPG
jgi:hypothetical protein